MAGLDAVRRKDGGPVVHVVWRCSCPRDCENKRAMRLARQFGQPIVLLPGMTLHREMVARHGDGLPFIVVDGQRIDLDGTPVPVEPDWDGGPAGGLPVLESL